MAFFRRHPAFKTFEAALSQESPQIREATLAYLRSHRSWYASCSRAYTLIWNISNLSIIVLGALSSILFAYGTANKVLLTTLPALSSLLGAILIQFKLRDVWRLRELGRIAVEELICQAYLIPLDDRDAALKAAVELRLLVHKLERDQLSEFFGQAPDVRTSSKSRNSKSEHASSKQGPNVTGS
jgi:hypothetical protein